MFVHSTGFEIGQFVIPPFELREGELIGVCLYGGSHFFDLESELVTLFTQKRKHPNLIVGQPFRFVERVRENAFRRLGWPTTVKDYLKAKGKKGSPLLEKIYEVDNIQPHTRISTLYSNRMKWLSLYVTLSHTNRVVFDLTGQDPISAEKTYAIIKECIQPNGAAILLDNVDDPEAESQCSQYLRIGMKSQL
jgi:hypothetical protein